MKLKAKSLNISTGGIKVILLHGRDAVSLGLNEGDRVQIKPKNIIAVINTTEKYDYVKKGEVGIFNEIQEFGIKSGSKIELIPARKPESISYILKKLKGKRLKDEEIFRIIKDIVDGKLTDIEMTYFVSACYMNELNFKETVALTKAMIDTGDKLKFGKNKIIADKHCIGGVAGNRTTAFVVPIVASAGITIPKTSSRSITSPAGTADTMEVLCNVALDVNKIKRIINKIGACMVWGGSLSLAPSDDKIIKVEHPVSLDPSGQLLASILSKKKSVGATHCLIDIPLGKGAKIEKRKEAIELKNQFEKLSKEIDLKLKVVITDGSEPIGNGIGPALEARDLLWILKNDPRGPKKLLEKGIDLAGELLELTGKAKKNEGRKIARKIVETGKAHKKFMEILKAQGQYVENPEQIKIARLKIDIKSSKEGKITHIDNKIISKIAKLAGAPSDKSAGIYMYLHKKDIVEKNEPLFTIYASTKSSLDIAKKYASKKLSECYKIKN